MKTWRGTPAVLRRMVLEHLRDWALMFQIDARREVRTFSPTHRAHCRAVARAYRNAARALQGKR